MAAVALIFLLAAWLCISTCSCDCELPIRRRNVLGAWHSSHGYGQNCFQTRNQTEESDVLSAKTKSHQFIHSNGSHNATGGFHWFAVQLNEAVLIRSVTVKGREDSETITFGRSVGIEIWTSNSSQQLFSQGHCFTKNMSQQFSENQSSWELCGVTRNKTVNITYGELFTVECLAEVRHLLLRRNVTLNFSSSDGGYLSISDLTLQTVQLVSSSDQFVAVNSSLTVSCSLHCNGSEFSTNSSELQLCQPNGNCTAGGKLQIARAQPQHSGIYTCKVGSTQHSTSVTVLFSSSDQFVAVNSSLTVNCTLQCNGSELNSSELQLCQPNGSCTAGGKLLQITRAQPHHSGIYTCKVGSVVNSTSVYVLSSSPDQVVAEKKNFTVNCTLHFNGLEQSSNSRKLQLCQPNSSCTAGGMLQIAWAQPHHSGKYTCKLNSLSTNTSTSVTVLYTPSSVSVSLLSSDSCKSPSDVTVNFTSSASLPVPQHRCSIKSGSGGIGALNLKLLIQNSSGNGFVSLWQLEGDAEHQPGWHNGSIECSAVQSLPPGIQFQAEHSATAEWSCKFPRRSPAAVLISTFSALVIIGIFVGLLLAMKVMKRRESNVAEAQPSSLPIDIPVTDAVQESRESVTAKEPAEPECSYLSVLPAGVSACASCSGKDCPEDNWESESECTVYLEIVATQI